MKAWHPEEKEIVLIVSDPIRTPIWVHCQHGAVRTGTQSVICRVVIQGWSVDDAIAEMNQDGFGFHTIWMDLERWRSELDIVTIKKRTGIVL